ncbi:YbjN domain-containing protein [Haliangium ochraceum]|uniref:TY-Chap central domain-containing protein n=1 Tax=Haliangium ochraceum (strain DSM 14365 / JCM 11303 / SMP-2) TaxID=502025 RepID=D0LW80_HALO1|nr:YbjN domain-containing protein [Haliangium ochraceum]ACY16012.1 Domain of unknown function DUF1821 [Haliangium ochraceum DSM 14365]
MTLFDDGREANIKSTIAMVEDVLHELGHEVAASRSEPSDGEQRAWQVEHGSATVRIGMGERGGVSNLRVVSTVMTLDPSAEVVALLRRLLELNRTTLRSAAFALEGDYVQIVAERPTLDLDRSEVLDLIRRIEKYADDLDDELVAQFGGKLGRI